MVMLAGDIARINGLTSVIEFLISSDPFLLMLTPLADMRSTSAWYPGDKPLDEKTLVRAVQTGDLAAFNHLVLAYQDMLYQHAYAMLGERRAAEDITQEAFIKAYRGMPRFRGGSLRAWLLKIATNACYDELRREQHRVTGEEWAVNEDGEEIEPLESLNSPDPSLEDMVERGELRQALDHALARLPKEYRAVAVIVDVLGFDYTEAAASLGVPIGTVKSRLARARQGLRRHLLRTPELVV
jgi:RNA polymerase sigma-70 factor (ECF subfamily)